MNTVKLLLLRDTKHGGEADQPHRVAKALAEFISAAKTSVALAIYDFRLGEALAKPVVDALVHAASTGVSVRIAYDASKPEDGTLAFAALGADPAPVGTAAWLREQLGDSEVVLKPITTPSGKLMHDKYVVVDGKSVWTGSTNFTDDAWTRQENNVLQVNDSQVAAAFLTDFEQLWLAGDIRGTGHGDRGAHKGIAWSFAPGEGKAIDADLVSLIGSARQRLLIASMVITSHTVLAALVAAIDRGVHLTGIYDSGQMGPISRAWAKSEHSADTLRDWKTVSGQLADKRSEPYSPTGVHNFMHLKVLVSDDTVATGSYNFSANAEGNAENQLRITSPAIADQYAQFVQELVATYK
ncbi:phosphatidylserine/phosphatidylglycerophosphate/cardiolipin synthase-like enzyme [Kutzneria viridogrisea]|nr:phosphatidylserine/phosphatidylglycerophosphate/cardiolipin synthase family protein [Kutzneria albida]MBA8928501.1 phosphatidylserine/phosphatidylglycerophosphate/cardiolipin synthase-like enzyme [Kutzneria viridogrisea]